MILKGSEFVRIAVIDDEKYSRVELVHQIRSHIPDAEISEAGNGVQAIALIEREMFDILFIDIHLGDLEGTTVASLARKLMPKSKIIFATAYSEYAVKAFELRVDDYVLKPFDPSRIKQVLEQCTEELDQTGLNADHGGQKIAVSINRHTTLLDIDDVTYIETDGSGRGCVIHMSSGDTFSDNSSLSDFENRLSRNGFFRIHKTCLVQLKYIQDIFPWSNSSFALRLRGSSNILPIGRDKVKDLRRKLRI